MVKHHPAKNNLHKDLVAHRKTVLNRWFNKVPYLGEAVDVTQALPSHIQLTIADYINEHVDKYIESKKRNATYTDEKLSNTLNM